MRSQADVVAAFDQIDREAPNVFAFDAIAMRSIRGLAGSAGRRTRVEMSEAAAMRALDGVLDSADRTWVARQRCEEAIGEINRDGLRWLDAAISVAQASLRVTNRRLDAGVPHDVAYVVNTLSVRTQATCHEISALLRAGFPAGARGRWRTLYEVAVVSSVLMLGNRYTASRFKNHRWVMVARDRDHVGEAESWPARPTPEVMRSRLVQRYGREYAHPYGWASPVTARFLDVRVPKWHHLEKLADLADGHRPRVKEAHHAVHVDSLGGLDLLDSSGTLHAGGRIDGSLPVVWQTIRALSESTDSLLAIWERYDPAPMVSASRAYADRMLFEIETDVSRRDAASI